jgi:hypothetical protein
MVAIKDMEMPKSCAKCLLLWEGKVTNRCRKNMKDVTDLPTRPDWCPLVEIVTCEKCRHRDLEFLNASGKCKCMKNYNLHDLNDYCKDGEFRVSGSPNIKLEEDAPYNRCFL